MIAASFTKLFASITDSSIWSENSDTKVVWVTMLAMSDQFGRVCAAIPGLAKRSGVSLQATEEALNKFLAPDKFSRTKDHEGRRIEVIEGGWRLLNHELYRDIKHEEDRKEQNRQAQQRRRKRLCQQDVSVNDDKSSNSQQNVSIGQQKSAESAHTDTYTYTKEEEAANAALSFNSKKTFKPPTKFLHQWSKEYRSFFNTDYVTVEGKDELGASKLTGLRDMTPEQVLEIAKKAWRTDAFYCKQSRTLHRFATNFNDILGEVGVLKAPSKTSNYTPRPSGDAYLK